MSCVCDRMTEMQIRVFTCCSWIYRSWCW